MNDVKLVDQISYVVNEESLYSILMKNTLCSFYESKVSLRRQMSCSCHMYTVDVDGFLSSITTDCIRPSVCASGEEAENTGEAYG